MHILTITTKYTFGDKVRFDSRNGKGTGEVFAIEVDKERCILYVIEIDMGAYSDLQPGILESEITGMERQDDKDIG
jgi:hypothetical protein